MATVGAALRGRPFHGEGACFLRTGGHGGPPLQLLLAVVIKAFGLALVAYLRRFWFLLSGLVIGFGPMMAIRAAVPYLLVAFASIDFHHVR